MVAFSGVAAAIAMGAVSLGAPAKPSAAAGKAISGMCGGCHGSNGIG